jgi:uncharacterized protein (TIGR03437 family)
MMKRSKTMARMLRICVPFSLLLLAISALTPSANGQAVQGNLDAVESATCEVLGWARDLQNTTPIQVLIYRDGDNTSGTLVTSFIASLLRSDLPFSDQNHGFDHIFVGDAGLSDGKDHTIYAYGVSNAGVVGALTSNGQTLHCGVLSATVTSYGAKGDGVTDDSDAIQNAIDDTAPGGTVVVPSGTYIIATSHGTYASYGANSCGIDPNTPQDLGLNITKTNITLKGAGRSSILMLGPSAKMVIVNMAGPHALLEELVFDGNGANRLRRDANGQILNFPCGLVVAGLITGDQRTIGSCTIYDCEMRNGIEDGGGMFLSPNFTVMNAYVHNNGGINLDPSAGQAAGALSIGLGGGANATAADNIVVGNTYGIAVGFGSVGVNLSHNVILHVCEGGMFLGGSNDATPPPVPDSNFTVTHNWVEANGPTPSSLAAAMPCNLSGVIIENSQNGTFTNNHVWNNTYYAGLLNADRGEAWPVATNWQITDNDIENNQSVGIDIGPRAVQFALTGNTIANNGNSLGSQVAIDPTVASQVNADWATANDLSYTPPESNPLTPLIAPGGIVSAASSVTGGVSPGEILAIYGSNLGPTQLTVAEPGSDGRFERIVAGTRVLFDGVPGVMLYTSAGQIAVIAPYYLYWKDNTVVQVEYNGVKSAGVTIPIEPSQPAIFTVDSSGKGPGSILNQDYSLNSAANPAARGSIVMVYATGEGQTDPAGTDGLLANAALPKPRLPVSVTVGGVKANVPYAGAVPTLTAGIIQINVAIPANAPTGASVPVQISVGNATSPAGVTLSVN